MIYLQCALHDTWLANRFKSDKHPRFKMAGYSNNYV